MSLIRPLLAAASVGVLTAVAATPASAGAAKTIASWQMNEASGAKVMVDSSGNALNGSIGSAVVTGMTFAGAKGYHWDYTKPIAPPVKPERLILVPDNGLLDPGTKSYSVTIRYRTTHPGGNIIQKGQATSTGGYWKFEQPHGIMKCLFRGSGGSRAVGSGTKLNDGKWHVVRCDRTSAGVTMTIDGVVVKTQAGPTGSISNTWPLSIGGKSSCNQDTVTCDYFTGEIDYVTIRSG